MQTITAGLLAHYALETTSLCLCCKIVRKDFQSYGFTSLNRDIVVGAITYRAGSGFSPSAMVTSSNLAVDNLDIMGFLDSEVITEQDIMCGKWDFAEVYFFEINWRDTSLGYRKLRRGRLGSVKLGRHKMVAELFGMMYWFNNNVGERYSVTCRVKQLGDSRCKISLGSWTENCTVTALISNNQVFEADSTEADDYYNYGKLTWTSGLNDGYGMEVKRYENPGHFLLALPMPYDIAVGDTFTVIAGCDRRFQTCKTKFNNVVNFRGEPHVPGTDKMLRGPDY